MHVLFVCTGNICRSPIAERLALAYARKLEIADFRASSAGTRAVIAHPMDPESARVVQEMGGSASDFAARQLTAKIAASADLVVTMARQHRDAVLGLAPRLMGKTFTIAEASILAKDFGARRAEDLRVLRPQLAGKSLLDVPDPIGQRRDVFESVGQQIASMVLSIVPICRCTN
ncbi:arsenate reductase/protein-tyrosine-phosphatase family protein [Mycobacterium sp. C3-094]